MIKYSVDTRNVYHLNEDDVEIAVLMIQDGMTRIEIGKEFYKNGHSKSEGMAIASCAHELFLKKEKL